MPARNPEQIVDMVKTTQKHRVKSRWVDITQKYNTFVMADAMQDKSRHEDMEGFEYSTVVQVENNSNARLSGCYDYDRTYQQPLNKTFEATLAQIRTNVEWDIFEKIFNEGTGVNIIKYVDQKMHSMESNLVEFTEDIAWEAPSSPNQDPKPFLGVQHWLQRGTADAFNRYGGKDPAGWEAVGRGGILSSEVEHWANATFRYQAINTQDFVRNWRLAARKCKFMAPKGAKYKNLIKEGGSNNVYYGTTYMEQILEELLESKNENFGTDLAKYEGAVMFRSNPFQSVDWLDENTTDNPMFGMNWDTFKFLMPKGAVNLKSEILTPSDRSSVRLQVFYNWLQLICLDLRRNFVAHQTVAA